MQDLINKYKLTQQEHEEVLSKLKQDIFKDTTSYPNPSIIFVIGQPGCGKTTYINNTNFSKYIIINSDNYRYLHKYSKNIR